MLNNRPSHKILVSFALLILAIQGVNAEQIDNFSSDGCSQFPDGTLAKKNLWCDCCIAHDIAYWQGGSREQKKQADTILRECVLQKTGSGILANSMYYGVILGGSPIFPTWYRWGYGWSYGRGYQALDQYEKQQVEEKLQNYRLFMPQSFCDFEHPVKVKAKEGWQNFMDMFD